jgi:CRP/FNR family transcriptional regulator
MDNEAFSRLIEAFPFLGKGDEALRREIMENASIVRIPQGEYIFFEGDKCIQLALVIKGTVRVYKSTESGHEITLYRLGRGDSCILTASCIYADSNFPAVVVTEDDVEAAVVPAPVFRRWVDEYPAWRDYLFSLLSRRLADVIATVEEVAFRRMDVRIAEFLLGNRVDTSQRVVKTHQEIARELGTSREVVSRILKHMELKKIVALHRGYIEITDAGQLKKIFLSQRPAM